MTRHCQKFHEKLVHKMSIIPFSSNRIKTVQPGTHPCYDRDSRRPLHQQSCRRLPHPQAGTRPENGLCIPQNNILTGCFSPDSHQRRGESGMSGHRLGVKRCRCDGMQALAARKLYFPYVGGRKVKQNAQMRFFEQAADRPRETKGASVVTTCRQDKKLLTKPMTKQGG